ncbi:hypothetical protein SDC9_93516 [bioreactor metagenome]|uniref:Uncharacterized protein n=1 Tax=bioreactor metagenome TaxID=1076179 RepID=A0A645A0U9_9ZZZZ
MVLGAAGNGWYKVDFNTIEGYMSADHLSISASAEASLGYAYINIEDGTLNLRSGPGTDYSWLTAIPAASVVPISGISGAWYKVSHNGQTGYISSEYVLLVQDASGTRADGNGVSAAAVSATSSSADQLITYAKQFIGTPYVYGANGPKSFDCSGFTKYIFAQFGVSLNRTATNQLSNGVSVTRSQLQPGDLVFFKYRTSKPVSHVGIYIGGGKFIHASTNSYRVCIDDMSSGHYYNVFVYGRRVL